MTQLTTEAIDHVLARMGLEVTKTDNTNANLGLHPAMALLNGLNAELAKDSGSAGTHAYDMMAGVEEINSQNTEVLIQLIAAMTLYLTKEARVVFTRAPIVDGSHESISLTFSPTDIDDMQKRYVMDAKRDGMLTTVTITRREEPAESWLQDATESGEGAKPQAEATDTPDRPVWAIRVGTGALIECQDKADAEANFKEYHIPDALAAIENRFCLHESCPSTHCTVWGFNEQNPGNGQSPDGN